MNAEELASALHAALLNDDPDGAEVHHVDDDFGDGHSIMLDGDFDLVAVCERALANLMKRRA